MISWADSKTVKRVRAFLRTHWVGLLSLRQKFRFSEETFHLLLAGGVGVMGGLVNLFFYYATESVKAFFLRRPGDPVEVAEMMVAWQRIVTPTVGGLCAGLVLYWGLRFAGPLRTSNILEVVVAGDGRLPFRASIVKFFSSLITIGSGGSIGREGGITQLSATFASKWGQWANWPPYRLRLLVGCGAASGIAAAYNAPISGAVFAALIVMGNFSMRLFAPLVFASVVATMVSRSFFGLKPWYTVPPFEFTKLWQLPWFICLGIVIGVGGALFLRMLTYVEDLYRKMKAPIYARLAVGGLVVGIIALAYPEVWGNGYTVTNRILHGEYSPFAFSAGDIIRPDILTARLEHPASEDGVSQFLATHLSESTWKLATNKHNWEWRLKQAYADDLNRIISAGPIYEAKRFADIKLEPALTNLIAVTHEGTAQVRLNSLLLMAAYPGLISFDRGLSPTSAALLFLAGLLLAKVLATLATVGSGAVGGVFTPTLFLGAATGATFALMLQQFGAAQSMPVAPFAVVGMGSALSATTRSPMLAIIMVFEISLDYSLMPALMLACVVSFLVSRRLHPASIYTESLRRRGLKTSEGVTASEAATAQTVGDLMRDPVAPVRETATLREVADRFLVSANNFLPVVDGKNVLIGLVALQDLKEHLAGEHEMPGVIALDFMRPPPLRVTPTQQLLEVLPVIIASEQRNIPVVSSLEENLLLGALVRAEVLSLFSEAMSEAGESGG